MSKPRPALAKFAEYMEDVLRENDWKCGWHGMTISRLIQRTQEELDEVKEVSMEHIPANAIIDNLKRMKKEVADVANFCMMLNDIIDDCIREMEEMT